MKIVVLNETGEFTEKDIKNETDIYKKCNYRKNTDFIQIDEWKVNETLKIKLFGKKSKKLLYDFKYLKLYGINAFVLYENDKLISFDIKLFRKYEEFLTNEALCSDESQNLKGNTQGSNLTVNNEKNKDAIVSSNKKEDNIVEPNNELEADEDAEQNADDANDPPYDEDNLDEELDDDLESIDDLSLVEDGEEDEEDLVIENEEDKKKDKKKQPKIDVNIFGNELCEDEYDYSSE